MWEIANHGEFEEDQVQCGREYERQAWQIKLEMDKVKGQ